MAPAPASPRSPIPAARLIGILVALCLALGAGLVVVAAGLSSSDGDAEPGTGSPVAVAARPDAFDARGAFAELRRQVRMGPRPTGSPAARRLARRIRRTLPRGRFEAIAGHPGLRNVVGRLPGRRPALVLAAHYDTKDLPDFVGANDGASGTAVLLELARVLRQAPRARGSREVRFVFFDGEESPDDDADFYATGLRGSKDYARRHADGIAALVLLDYVGEKNLRIPREAGSDAGLWRRLRAAARRVGAGRTFPDATAPEVLDDHTPFVRAGVPAIDLIDFDFPCFHKACDDLAGVSAASLDAVGETVFALARELSSPGRGPAG